MHSSHRPAVSCHSPIALGPTKCTNTVEKHINISGNPSQAKYCAATEKLNSSNDQMRAEIFRNWWYTMVFNLTIYCLRVLSTLKIISASIVMKIIFLCFSQVNVYGPCFRFIGYMVSNSAYLANNIDK